MKLTTSLIAIVGSLLCISPIFGKQKQCKSNQECIKVYPRLCPHYKNLRTRVLSISDREEKDNVIAEMRKLVCDTLSVCCDKEESEAKADAKGDHEEPDSKAEGNHEASEPEAQDDHETSDPEDSYPEAEGDHEESEAEAEGDHEESEAEAEGSSHDDQNEISDTLGK